MAGPGLPENIDATYDDDAGDESVKTHQQHHDVIHDIVNKFDKDASPSDHYFWLYDSATGVYLPASFVHGHELGSDEGQVGHSDLSGVGVNDHHNQAHSLEGSDHSLSGRTKGQTVQAADATTLEFGFPWQTRFKSGLWYFNDAQGALTTRLLIQAQQHAFPFFVSEEATFTDIGASITTSGSSGSVIRFGIYADNGSNYPGTLIYDAGTCTGVSASPPEFTSITFGTAQTLPPGLYWLSMCGQGSPATQPTIRCRSFQLYGIFGSNASNPPESAPNGFYQSSISGAFSDWGSTVNMLTANPAFIAIKVQ